MKTAKTLALVGCLIALTVLAACGGNNSDADYDAWQNQTLPQAMTAVERLESELPNANDYDAAIAICNEVVAEIETALDALRAIDRSKLSDEQKGLYDGNLANLEENITNARTAIAAMEALQSNGGGDPPDQGGHWHGDEWHPDGYHDNDTPDQGGHWHGDEWHPDGYHD